MAGLAVVSVHTPSQLSNLWVKLQQDFLAEYTEIDYDYYIFANCVDITSPAHITKSHELLNHRDALLSLLSELPKSYQYLLILDSDCFPGACWFKKYATYLRSVDIVAPIRYENRDTFPHPCMVFCRANTPLNPDYRGWKDVFGKPVRDLSFDPKLRCYPLIRGNRINYHPLLGAIYGDFYHHGCGSREIKMRGMDNNLPHQLIHREMIAKLETNPKDYLKELMWSNSYVLRDKCDKIQT